MAASSPDLHWARRALERYMKRRQIGNIWTIDDHTDVLIEASIMGDLATFRSLDAFFTILYEDKSEQPRPSAALYHAARHGQWDLIKAVANPTIQNSYVQCDLHRMPYGAIKGGHLWLIATGMKDPSLRRYFLEIDLELFGPILKYNRNEIFDFYLKMDYNDQLHFLSLPKIIRLVVDYKSVEGLLTLQTFKRTRCCDQNCEDASPLACDACLMLLAKELSWALEISSRQEVNEWREVDPNMVIGEVISGWRSKREAKIKRLLEVPVPSNKFEQVPGRIFRVNPPPVVLLD
jgi:hypothetical protein